MEFSGDVAMAILAIDCLYIQQLFYKVSRQKNNNSTDRKTDGQRSQTTFLSLFLESN